MTRCAISGARSAVKIFLFPVAKRAGAVCTVYTSRLKERTRAIRATNRCFIRACPARRIEEDRSPPPPRPTYTNLLHSRFNPVHTYIHVGARDPSQGTPRRQRIQRVSSTVYWSSNTSLVLPASRKRTRRFDRTRVITWDKASP